MQPTLIEIRLEIRKVYEDLYNQGWVERQEEEFYRLLADTENAFPFMMRDYAMQQRRRQQFMALQNVSDARRVLENKLQTLVDTLNK